MDKRERPASKRYRNDTGAEFKTVSMNIGDTVIKKLEEEIENSENQNMSAFIEDLILENIEKVKLTADSPTRRPYGSYPGKKTYTFSSDMIEKLQKMYPERSSISFLIESLLVKILNIS